MKPSDKCISLIQQFEGLRLDPYLDSAGIPTIGYGSIYHLDGSKVSMDDDTITKSQAVDMLTSHLITLAKNLEPHIDVDLSQNQTDAILDLAYNIGIGNFTKSTLLKLLNTDNIEGAAEQFLVWDRAGGKIVAGLTNRRNAEKELFLS